VKKKFWKKLGIYLTYNYFTIIILNKIKTNMEMSVNTTWYNKKQIISIFDISSGTYYKKLKQITDSEKIKMEGKSKLVHHSIVEEFFKRKNKKGGMYGRTPEEQKNWEVWSAVHCYYGFDTWMDISDKIGDHIKGSIPQDTIEDLIKEFINNIKNSNKEVDVNFINDFYNEDSERCDRIIREEYLGNIKYFMKE
jgi:hypothetical protein